MSSEVKPFPVEKEYEKNPDISPADILKLREWLETQPHLPVEYITDLDLILSYHCCDKSPEVSKQVLDLHFTLKTLFTSFFKDRVIDDRIVLTLNTVLFVNLPMPTVKGCKATYIRLIDPDPRPFCYADALRVYAMLFDLWQLEEGTWPGLEIIVDFDMVSIGHMKKVELMVLRQLLCFLQEAMLVKLKRFHFMNASSFVDKLMMMMRPFVKRRVLHTMLVHQRDSETLYKYIPKASLPKDCGGDYKDFDTLRDEQIVYAKNNAKYFEEENRKRINEALREGKTTTVEDLFGIEGSFKKLDID